MGLFSKSPRSEKCKACKAAMEKRWEQLYAMPRVYVGHYVQRTGGNWYRENLVPLDDTSRLLAGIYAARVELWRCPGCGGERAVVRPFLPVRASEMKEFPVILEGSELNAFLGK